MKLEIITFKNEAPKLIDRDSNLNTRLMAGRIGDWEEIVKRVNMHEELTTTLQEVKIDLNSNQIETARKRIEAMLNKLNS